jgi:hypothetical protein
MLMFHRRYKFVQIKDGDADEDKPKGPLTYGWPLTEDVKPDAAPGTKAAIMAQIMKDEEENKVLLFRHHTKIVSANKRSKIIAQKVKRKNSPVNCRTESGKSFAYSTSRKKNIFARTLYRPALGPMLSNGTTSHRVIRSCSFILNHCAIPCPCHDIGVSNGSIWPANAASNVRRFNCPTLFAAPAFR